MTTIDEAHRRVKEFASHLEREGFDRGHIIDALIVVGLNAAARTGGTEATAATMVAVAEQLKTTGQCTRAH